MPILGGFFSKRDKHKPQPPPYVPYKQSNSSDGDDSASIVETVETSPSSPGSPPAVRGGNPVYGSSPLATSASSSKIRLGFRRKTSSTFVRVDKHAILNASLRPPIPRPPNSPSAFSEPGVEHFRPPAKGALFSAYGDPQGALSTRSLPSDKVASHSRSKSRDVASADNLGSTDVPPPRQQQPSKKSGGLFAWAQRDRKKSQPSASRAPERPPPRPSLDLHTTSSPDSRVYSSDSFNLKSFRHVGSSDASPPELPVPRPPSVLSGTLVPPARPRGNSVASDSSQRISVAAFREVAARRNNSPSPSVARPPSRSELLSPRLDVSSSRPSIGSRPGITASSSSLKPSPKPSPPRNSTLRPTFDSSSSSESEYEESDDDEDGTLRPKRGDTVTQRNPGPTATTSSSELGHRLRVPAPGPERVARTTSGRGEADAKRAETKSADLSVLTKGNASSSALQANGALDRPSTMLALASSGYFDGHKRTKSMSSSSSSSSGSDSDDAPLATLMMPKRPGSSASNATTGSRPRMPPKPLIDINSLSSPSLPMPIFGEGSLTMSPTDEKFVPPSLPEEDMKEDGNDRKPTLNHRLARVAQTAAGASTAKSVDILAGIRERRTESLDLLRDRDTVANGVSNMTSGRAATPSSPHAQAPTRSQTAPIGFDPSSIPALSTHMFPNTPSSSSSNRSQTPDPATARGLHKSEKRLSLSSSPNPNAVVDLTDPTPIRPTPVRSRSPQTSFSVTSRPSSQMSLGTSSPVEQQSSRHAHSQSQDTIQPPRPESRLRHEQEHPTVRIIGGPTLVTSSADSTSSESSDEESESDEQHATHRSQPQLMPSSSRTTTVSASPQPRPQLRKSSDVLAAPPPRTSSMYALDMPDSYTTTTRLLIPAGGASTASSSSATSSPVSTRKRASTLVPSGGFDASKGFTGGGLLASIPAIPEPKSSPGFSTKSPLNITKTPPGATKTRQRSSTMYENSPTGEKSLERPSLPSASHASPPVKPLRSSIRPPVSQSHTASGYAGLPPPRPFAGGIRGNSPSASSTGDSSSTGRTPLTPRDGSEIGVSIRGGDSDRGSTMTGRFSTQEKEKWGGSTVGTPTGVTAMRKAHGHKKNASVTFDEPEKGRSKDGDPRGSDDERRRERRRSEAKAAIELGNVVNGRGPIANVNDDDDLPLNSMGPRMSMNMLNPMNPMFNLTPPTPMTWRPPSSVMGSGMNMNPMAINMFPAPPPNADPAFLAAHQQAMMVAKQAYQYAVAQQAMAQANEEWERGSTATSAFGGGGSTYGGGMNMGMMGMNPMSPAMFPGYGMWPGPMMFPPGAQSMYAGSVVGSDIGGGSNAGWGSRSAYGDIGERSGMFRNGGGGFSSSASAIGVGTRPGARPRTKTAPSSKHPPPSSWKRPA